jgi:hypothetical protein
MPIPVKLAEPAPPFAGDVSAAPLLPAPTVMLLLAIV